VRESILTEADQRLVDVRDAVKRLDEKREQVPGSLIRDRCYDLKKQTFSAKNLAKMLAFFVQTNATFCKKFDHNTDNIEKNAYFSQKFVIIISTPDRANLVELGIYIDIHCGQNAN
jgi:hypothetical protein